MKKFEDLTGLDLLTLCIYGEARNQGLDGMLAVGSVVLNRAARPRWWGNDVKSVILKPWQFSCFNEGDPNRDTLEGIAEDFDSAFEILEVLKRCFWIAQGLIDKCITGNVGPATHYHTRQVSPDWKDKLKFLTQVGDHLFYEEV